MMTTQLLVVEQNEIRPHSSTRRVALFGPDGNPLLFSDTNGASQSEEEVTTGQLNHLKGRVTKLEKRIKDLAGE